jgi:Flp pilus assembly protein TadD
MTSRRDAARALLLLAIAVAVYAPVLDATFLHDDDELVTGNPIVQRGGRGFGAESWAGLRELWLPPSGAITRNHLPGIPVTATAMWLQWRLFGSNDARAPLADRGPGAPAYHVVNVLLHALCALLLWRVLVRLAIPGAWWASLLWAVHPVCVESVAWIAEQKNTLSLAFLLASALAWLRWTDARARAAWVLSVLSFALALLAKPTVVPFPLVLLLLAWWRRRPIGAELRAALPFFALSLAAGLFAVFTQSTLSIGGERIAVGTPIERIHQASFALGFYVWKALLPQGLVVVYPRWHETIPWPLQLVPALLVALLLALSWRARERWGRAVILGFGGFALMLAPVLGLVPMSYLRHTLVADHFAYAALPFLVALVVAAAASWPRLALQTTPLAAAAGAVAAAFAWQTVSYARVFHDPETLWSYAAEKNPSSWTAHDQIGQSLLRAGRPHLALEHFERAVALAPDRAEVHNNLAVLLDGMGRRDEALTHILRAAELVPENGPIRINCATSLLAAGRPGEALPHFAAALRLLPDDPMIRIQYGTALLQTGRSAEAIAQARAALALDPARLGAQRLLAAAQQRLGEPGS